MIRTGLAFCLSILCLSAPLLAQSPSAVTTTTGGAAGTIPVFTTGTNVENSVITQASGNVGIGTTNPLLNLQVNGVILMPGSTGNTMVRPPVGSSRITGEINGGNPAALRWDDGLLRLSAGGGTDANAKSFIDLSGYSQVPDMDENITFGTTGIERMRIDLNGNLGIGTTSHGARLEVNGGIALTSGSNGVITFQDGTQQSTAFIPANCGADYAESVGVSGDRTNYEPGDLLVIDPDNPGKFLKSNQAYSTMVAGVYSTKPGFVGRKQPASDPASKDEIPMAMVGRVPTKVSAENGPIKVGDLLVTSSTMGYAMKGTDRSQMLGAVIGKALGSLDSGTGVIEVLVTLQ